MKEYIKKFKELWAVTRYRGLMKLGLGILFMVIVYLLIGGFAQMVPMDQLPGLNDSNTNKVTTNVLDNYKNMESFEFSYVVDLDNGKQTNTYKIDGTYYNKNYYFEAGGKTYYQSNNVLYVVDDSNKKLIQTSALLFNALDVKLLNTDSLHTFMSSSTDNGSTKYKDGSEVKKYLYTSYDNKKIYIEGNAKNNFLNNLTVDFKEFVSGYKTYKVTIEYKNINNLLQYDKDYTNYEITKEGV